MRITFFQAKKNMIKTGTAC